MNAELTFHRIFLPAPLTMDVVTRLLARLIQPDTPRPLVFESRADDTGIIYLIGTTSDRVAHVAQLLEQHLPGARFGKVTERIGLIATGRITMHPAELPLDLASADAAIYSLYGALASRQPRETVALQIVLGRGHRPTLVSSIAPDPRQRGIWDALVSGTAIASSEVRTRLRQRAEQPTVDVVVRIGVTASTPARRQALAMAHLGAIRSLEAPGVRLELAREKQQLLQDASHRTRTSIRLTASELAPLTGWPVGESSLPGLPDLHPKRLGAPATLTRTDSLFAATTAPGDERLVGIHPDGHLQHLVVTGPTGSGKSMVFAHLILADIAAGRPCVVVDPKRQLIDFVLDRIPEHATNNTVVLDAADTDPVGFNPLDTEGRNTDVVVDGILSAFKAVFAEGWGPRTEDLLHAGLLSLASAGVTRGEPHTLLDLPKLLTDSAFRRTVVGAVGGNPTLAAFWASYDALSAGARANVIAAPMNKLRKYVLRQNLAAVLGQSQPRFRLRDVFREGKTVLVPLNDALLGPGAAQLLGSLITSELWMATLERASQHEPTKRPASIYIDEVQQFLHLPTSIADALATSRSYGVSWNLAHQYRAQLSPSMRAAFDSNARNKVVFASGSDDARDLARMAPGLEAEDFMTLPPYEVYARLVDKGAPTNWFSARTLPPERTHSTRALVIANSRLRYGQMTDDTVAPPEEAAAGSVPPTNRKARRS